MSGAVGRADAVSLLGVTQLMNPQHVRYDVEDAAGANELTAAEDAFVDNGGGAPGGATAPLDAASILGDDILGLADEIGIDLSELVGTGRRSGASGGGTGGGATGGVRMPASAPLTATQADTNATAADAFDIDLKTLNQQYGAPAVPDDFDNDSSGDGEWESGSDDDDAGSDDDSDAGSDAGSDSDSLAGAEPLRPPRVGADRQRRVDGGGGYTSVGGLMPGGDLEALTHEEANRRHISAVLNQMGGEGNYVEDFALDREQLEDLKLQKLDKIENLIITMQEDDIAVNVPELSMDSPMAEIDKTMRRLQLKADRSRYSTIAEEILMGGAECIEGVFDGSRRLPLMNYAPDYRGYSGTVSVKLRRMRLETSQLVGDTMRKWNIGPLTRMLIELLPSFILYPRQQGNSNRSKELYTREQVARSQGVIRDRESLSAI